MLRGEVTNTNFTFFGLTRPGLEPTIYRTRCEHVNHYATDADSNFYFILFNSIGDVMVSVLASSAADRGFWWCNG